MTFESGRDEFLAREIAEDEDEGLNDEYKKLAEEFLGETDEKKEQLLSELREWIKKEKLRVPTRKAFLLKMMRATKFSPEGTKKLIKNYIGHLKDCSQNFINAHPGKISHVADEKMMAILPDRDQHGARVSIYRAGHWNPDKISVSDSYCLSYMQAELIALEPKTQIAGVTGISDAGGFSFRHLWSMNITDMRNSASFIQDCFPLYFRAIHVVNAPYVFSLAYNIVKPFLNERMKSRIVFHSSMDDLHKFVPKNILPAEFGGDKGDFDGRESFEAICKMEDYFKEVKTFTRQGQSVDLASVSSPISADQNALAN